MSNKRMSRREFLRGAGLTGLGLTLTAAGCQPQTVVVKETVKETVEVEVTREVRAPSAEPITIRFHGRIGTQGDHFSHFAHLFNERHHPDIFVKTELFPGADYYQKLDTMLAGGTVGDAFWIYLGGGYYQYAATGIYAALDALVNELNYDLGQFFPESVEAMRFEGNLYSLPWILNVGSASAVYYNKAMFDQAGLEYPTDDWTWDDLIETAVALADEDQGIYALLPSTYYAGTPVTLARSYGGDLISEDGTKCTLDEDETRQGLQILSDLYHTWKVCPRSGDLAGGSYQNFAAGRVAMIQSGFWGKSVDDYVAPGSWGVVPTPYGPEGRGNTMFVDMVGVTSASKHPKETFMYLTDLCTYEAGMDIWQVRKSVPACRPDVWNSEAALGDFHFKVYSDMMNKDGMPPKLPLVANFRVNEYWQVVNEGLEPIWLGEKTLNEVLTDVVQAGQAVLDKPSLV